MSESKELVATEQPQQVSLTVQDRAVIALGGVEREEALKALAKKYADITEIKNKAGRQQVHAAGMELANERIATKKTGETAREDANALQKAVIERQKVLIGITEPEEKRLLALRDRWDEAEEAEKIAKAAVEAARIAAIRQKIDAMRNKPASMVGRSSADIGAAADALSETVIALEEFETLAGEAQVERNDAVAKLRGMQATQLAVEQAAIEAARQAELDRIERERVAEANRVEAQRLADLAAELDRQAQEARDRQAEADRVAQEQREAAEAEQRAANERAAAAMRQQQIEHEQRMAAQQAELDRKRADIDRANAEQERIARERQEAAEAAAKLESDQAEALEENAAIDALRKLAAEARQQEEQRQAAEAERVRRERVQFVLNGPGDMEIALTLASHYQVAVGDAMQWLKKFDYEAADEQFAALNAHGELPQMEKAA